MSFIKRSSWWKAELIDSGQLFFALISQLCRNINRPSSPSLRGMPGWAHDAGATSAAPRNHTPCQGLGFGGPGYFGGPQNTLWICLSCYALWMNISLNHSSTSPLFSDHMYLHVQEARGVVGRAQVAESGRLCVNSVLHPLIGK